MKGSFLFLLILLTSVFSVEAQYGYGNGYYGRQRSAVPRTPTEQQEPEPKTAEEIVAQEIPRIQESIDLNDFELAVVSTILTKYVQQSIELRLLELGPEKTMEGMEKIRENQREELRAGLPEEKYLALIDLQKNGYKKKKGKKKKKKKKSKQIPE